MHIFIPNLNNKNNQLIFIKKNKYKLFFIKNSTNLKFVDFYFYKFFKIYFFKLLKEAGIKYWNFNN